MQSLRTISWVLFAIVFTLLAMQNLTPVEVWVFPGYEADTYLSIVILASFLLGFLPPYLVSASNRWRLQRKIKQQDDTIALLRPAPAAPTPPAPVIETPVTPLSTDPAA